MTSTMKPLTRHQIKLVRNRLLSTWQTGAAIAQHSGFPAKTVLAALKKHANEWGLETRIVRMDGHNQVHLFRRRQHMLVMGVSFPMAEDEMEEA